jgi:hypothetical protein
MSDAVLDDPGFLAARERFWTAALTDERYRENRVAVAEAGCPAGRDRDVRIAPTASRTRPSRYARSAGCSGSLGTPLRRSCDLVGSERAFRVQDAFALARDSQPRVVASPSRDSPFGQLPSRCAVETMQAPLLTAMEGWSCGDGCWFLSSRMARWRSGRRRRAPCVRRPICVDLRSCGRGSVRCRYRR